MAVSRLALRFVAVLAAAGAASFGRRFVGLPGGRGDGRLRVGLRRLELVGDRARALLALLRHGHLGGDLLELRVRVRVAVGVDEPDEVAEPLAAADRDDVPVGDGDDGRAGRGEICRCRGAWRRTRPAA